MVHGEKKPLENFRFGLPIANFNIVPLNQDHTTTRRKFSAGGGGGGSIWRFSMDLFPERYGQTDRQVVTCTHIYYAGTVRPAPIRASIIRKPHNPNTVPGNLFYRFLCI